MPTKHIENTTSAPIYVGGKMIPPGTGRDIDVAFLPPEHQEVHAAPEAVLPNLAEEVEALRQKSVKLITEALPSLTQEALGLLVEAEKAQKAPRVSLLTALEAEAIRRADAALQAEDDALNAKQLDGLTDEQLAAIGETRPAATPTPPAA